MAVILHYFNTEFSSFGNLLHYTGLRIEFSAVHDLW